MATSAPVPQGNPPDPQIIGERVTVTETFSRAIFGQRDPAGFKEFLGFEVEVARNLREKYRIEEAARLGLRPNDFLGTELTQAINRTAAAQAETAARQRFAPQIIAAGAGTSEVASEPLLAQQPQPPITPTNTAPVTPGANPQVPADEVISDNPLQVRLGGVVITNQADLAALARLSNDLIVRQNNLFRARRISPSNPASIELVNELEQSLAQGQSSYERFLATVIARARTAAPPAVAPDANPQVPAAAPTPPPGRPISTFPGAQPSSSQQVGDIRADGAVLTQFLDNGTPVFVIRPGATTPPPVTPGANPQVPDGSLPEEQASPGALSNAPVDPAVNPQVPAPPAAPAQQGVRIGDGGAAARAAQEQAARDNARAQAQLTAQKAQASAGDWRVKLRLAPGSDYLYNANEPGILQPLKVTDGVVFPYTPAISTQYVAQYSPTDLTHSNYRGYFYQSSHVGEIQLNAVFTAQDSNEAAYILAVIQFFRSVTKMFYGQQDAFRGSPPPLVFLQGLGEFQFNLAPCVVQTFNYTLPADVDYIRAGSPNIDGTNLQFRRDRQTAVTSTNPSNSRLGAAGLSPGGIRVPTPAQTLGKFSPTYVPTKIDINLILLPMQTRSQVSRQFSLEKFANGSLVQRGFW
jgi:hypothetical protein